MRILTLIVVLCQASLADDVATLSQFIDTQIESRQQAENVTPNPLIDDDGFLRRIMLDLAGRVPTLRELQDFRSDTSDGKRSRLIDLLLESEDYAFHQRNEIDLLLLARIRRDNEWRDYLLESTQQNKGWDQLFREVMIPEVEYPGVEGPRAFLRERIRELDDLTNDTAVLFFGVNISCAKCHDHPLVPDWEQAHYFGMASFFNRTFKTKSNMLAEKFDGNLKFKNVLGEEKPAQFMFLTGATVDEPIQELSDEERKALEEAVKQAQREELATPPAVGFSPREEFVELALADEDKDFFSRNIVNRIWARLMGRGFVMPLDQMHSENPPSHPELLATVANDLRQNNFDLKRLIKAIVNTRAYQRSAFWTQDSDPPPMELFALGEARPLTPRQLALSLHVASTNPEQLPGLQKPEDWASKRDNFERRSDGFSDLFPIPDESFQVGVDEALMFSNSDRFSNEFLRQSGDRLVESALKVEEPAERTSLLFQTILTREPNPDEAQAVTNYLTKGEDHVANVQQAIWALLASPEFRFNH